MSGTLIVEPILIRPAVESDARTLRRIIRQARISPLAIDWRRFLVAEAQDEVVGIGQIRPYADGTRELASLAVVPDWQYKGVATRLVQELLAPETGDVFLICQNTLEEFYQRFGFSTAPPELYPTKLGRFLRLGNIFFKLTEKIGAETARIIIMRRPKRPDYE